MTGAGRYDEESLAILKQTHAQGVLLLVINGDKGQGFSLNITKPEILLLLPKMLRFMADQIEADLTKGQSHAE